MALGVISVASDTTQEVCSLVGTDLV